MVSRYLTAVVVAVFSLELSVSLPQNGNIALFTSEQQERNQADFDAILSTLGEKSNHEELAVDPLAVQWMHTYEALVNANKQLFKCCQFQSCAIVHANIEKLNSPEIEAQLSDEEKKIVRNLQTYDAQLVKNLAAEVTALKHEVTFMESLQFRSSLNIKDFLSSSTVEKILLFKSDALKKVVGEAHDIANMLPCNVNKMVAELVRILEEAEPTEKDDFKRQENFSNLDAAMNKMAAFRKNGHKKLFSNIKKSVNAADKAQLQVSTEIPKILK